MEVRTTAAVEKIASLLRADAGIRSRTMGTDAVYAHRLPAPPADEAWARIVVRELNLPQGLPEHPSGLVQVQIQVMAECSELPDPDLLLESLHERAKAVLAGQRWTSAHGDTYLELTRYARSSAAQWDASTRCFYSTSTYTALLS